MAELSRMLKASSALAVALAIGLNAGAAYAQVSSPFPGFFQLERPGHFETTGYAGGFGSDLYGTLQEGFQFEQSVTRYFGLFGRLTGYQLWIGDGFTSPLNPTAGHSRRLNFLRAQGGFDFAPVQGTHLLISGGHDAADSDAYVIEGDFSTWLLLRSLHPVNFAFSALHDFQNGVTNSEIDLQAVLLSREAYMLMVGAGGAIYGGGFVTGVQGQAGPDLGFYYRAWRMGMNLQAGYGDAHQYGQISVFKQFSWAER